MNLTKFDLLELTYSEILGMGIKELKEELKKRSVKITGKPVKSNLQQLLKEAIKENSILFVELNLLQTLVWAEFAKSSFKVALRSHSKEKNCVRASTKCMGPSYFFVT